MGEENEGRFKAEAVACHACMVRDRARDVFDGPQHGVWWETTRKG